EQRIQDQGEEHDGRGGPEDAAEQGAAGRLLARGRLQDPGPQALRGRERGERARDRRRRLLVLAHQGSERLRLLQLLAAAGQTVPVQRPQRVERSQILVFLGVQWASPDRTGRACLNLLIPSLIRVLTVPRGSPRRWAICVWDIPSK